jgi:hypothetical protein
VITPKSDEYVLDQLSVIEEKLVKLYEELDAQGLSETRQQMSKDDTSGYFLTTMSDAKLPPYNTRIQMTSRGGMLGVAGGGGGGGLGGTGVGSGTTGLGGGDAGGRGVSVAFEDDEMSGDEGTEDFLNYRDQIKQASKQIVDSKTKRHQAHKKNKK